MRTIALSIFVLGLAFTSKAETSTIIVRSADTELSAGMTSSLASEIGPKRRRQSKVDRQRAKNRSRGSSCGDRRNRKVRGRR